MRMGCDALNIRDAQRMAESGPRSCCQDHSSQRKPHLSGSWEFYGPAEKYLGALGPRLIHKDSGSSPHQGNSNPCQGLPPPLLTATVRRHFTPGAQPSAGKWAVAQRLCRGRTAGGQDRGVNCTYPTPCGPVDTRH